MPDPKLTLSRTWSDSRDDDWTVTTEAGRSLARMYRDKNMVAERWYWSVNGFNVPQNGSMFGQAGSLDEAKDFVRPIVLRMLAAGVPLMPQPPEWKPSGPFHLGPRKDSPRCPGRRINGH